MGKYDFNEKDALASGGTSTGSKILDTGVYDVVINHATKEVAGTGTEGIAWQLQVEGHKYPNMIYGMWTYKANGDKLFSADIVQGLLGIIGGQGLTEFKKEIQVKDGTKTVTAYKELDGKSVKVAIQKVLDVYNGEVREKNEIKAFFNQEGKTYSEAVRGGEAKQIKYYGENLQDKETTEYKKFMADAPDEEPEEDSGSLL